MKTVQQGMMKNNWYKVTYKKKTGWISGFNMKEGEKVVITSIEEMEKNYEAQIGAKPKQNIVTNKVKIIDESGKEKSIGEVGEILVRGETVMQGYWNRKDETKKSFTKDGYFKTGDMGYLDKNDYLYFSSRKKNIIIVGGINVYPEDIEKSLKKNSQVKDCCVFGVKNKILGAKETHRIVISTHEEIAPMGSPKLLV